MKISVIYPSRQRPHLILGVLWNWIRKADTFPEFIVSVDTTDPALEDYKHIIEKNFPQCRLLVSNNKTAIEAINRAAQIATGDMFIVISDDFDAPEHWDDLLLEELQGKKDFIVKTVDGLQKTLITLPILDRQYYTRFGYIYNPDFEHLHCDEEMTIVAHMLGRVINSDLTFIHNHHTTGRFVRDAISVKNDNTWNQGQATLERHAKNNFGIERPLVRREDIVWK